MMKMSSRIAVLLLALCLCMSAALADGGNVNIAVRGLNGFEDYISSMFVWDGKLLMGSWDTMYVWDPEAKRLDALNGYAQLETGVYESAAFDEESGTTTYTIGDTQMELEEEEYLSMTSILLCVGESLYRVIGVYGEDGIERTLLVNVEIGEDGAFALTGVLDMDDMLTVDYGDGYTGIRDMINPCSSGSTVYCLSYGEDGRELLAIDLQNEDVEVMEPGVEGEISSIAPFSEGKLLLIVLDYNTDPVQTQLYAYDMETEEAALLGALPMVNWNSPVGIAYDPARSQLYYTLSGSVWRMSVTETGLGEPQEFGDMPLEVYDDAAVALLGDYYIVSSYDGVVGRDVTRDKLPEQRLRVANGAYSEAVKTAYFPFTAENPEFMVSVSSGMTGDALLSSMLNRSSEVDIFTMSASSGDYGALLERGFMAELGQSEALGAWVQGLYPALSDAVTREGEVYAAPIGMYVSAQAMNTALFTGKLGFTEEEIPGDWVSFFEMLGRIAQEGLLEEYPEVRILSPGYTQRDAKYTFFNQMMESCLLWMNQSEENLLRTGEVLAQVCQAFEKVDWAGLGLPEEYDYEDESAWEYEPENVLLETTSLQPRYYYQEGMDPLILAIVPGETPMLGMQVDVAFVNPFSTQREAALRYLEMVIEQTEMADRIALMPGENEPIESRYYEENLKYYDEMIADYEEQLASEELAEDSRDMITESLESMIEWRNEFVETGRWEVSEADIARYRKYAVYGVVERENLWSSGVYTDVYQYMDGAITAQQLIAELEKTLQMQRLEDM